MLMLSIMILAMRFRGRLYHYHNEDSNYVYVEGGDADEQNRARDILWMIYRRSRFNFSHAITSSDCILDPAWGRGSPCYLKDTAIGRKDGHVVDFCCEGTDTPVVWEKFRRDENNNRVFDCLCHPQ